MLHLPANGLFVSCRARTAYPLQCTTLHNAAPHTSPVHPRPGQLHPAAPFFGAQLLCGAVPVHPQSTAEVALPCSLHHQQMNNSHRSGTHPQKKTNQPRKKNTKTRLHPPPQPMREVAIAEEQAKKEAILAGPFVTGGKVDQAVSLLCCNTKCS